MFAIFHRIINNFVQLSLPIKLAAFPVCAQSRTLGLSGSPPALLNIFSACMAIAPINALFPTPKRIETIEEF
jgi:hypothetical protein